MRFVHAADTHLDSPLRNLALAEPHQIDRVRRATRDAFQAMIDLCIANGAKLLILAGDLWDGDAPNMQTGLWFRGQIARLERAGIRVVIKKGNHDAANRITSALDLPSNARIFDHRKPETIVYEDLGVALHGQSFTQGPVLENLAARYPAPVPGLLNIGVLHTSLAGGSYHDPYAPCSLSDLTTKGYAYWALGHIHKGETLNVNPWIVYPGNLQGRDIRETGAKGCVVVDTEGDQISGIDRVAVDVVRWHETKLDLSSIVSADKLATALRASLAAVYAACDGRPCATRVTLDGVTPLAAELLRRPDWLRQTVLETAAEISDEIWLVELRNETSLPKNATPGAVAAADLDIEGIIAGVAADAAVLAEPLRSDFETLRGKLPDALKSHPALVLADDPTALQAAILRIAPSLAARLSGERR